MARSFSGSQSLDLAEAVVSAAYPSTLVAWFTASGSTRALVAQGNSGENSYIILYYNAGDPGNIIASATVLGSGQAAIHTAPILPNTWYHGAAVFTSSTLREVYLDGSSTSDTGTRSAPTVDLTSIGSSWRSGGHVWYQNGYMAEVAIYNAALTSAEINILARGYSPRFVRPGNLLFYVPLVRDDDEDLIGGRSLTPLNSPTIAPHTRTIWPVSAIPARQIEPTETVIGIYRAGLVMLTFPKVIADTRKVTQTGLVTADANIFATVADSVTADAAIKRTLSGSITADANIVRTVTDSIAADATILATQAGSVTADATIFATTAQSVTADAAIKRTLSGSITADAAVRVTQSGSVTADAAIFVTSTDSVTADATILVTVSGSVTADATIKATQAGSVTADATIERTETDSITVDATIKKAQSGSITADAFIQAATQQGSVTADATIRKTISGSITADAYILGAGAGSVTVDAVIKKAQAGSVTVDATIKVSQSGSVSADAVVKALQVGSVTIDAAIKVTQTGAITADAAIGSSQSGSVTIDAEITCVGKPDWVSPPNAGATDSTPVLVFTIPYAASNIHFRLELDTVATFDSGNYQKFETYVAQTNWEYHNGVDWQPFPAGGVANTYAGNQCRYSVSTPLASGTWYRVVRGALA